MKDLPLQVGITGGIGSGKSLICRIFQCLGVNVYNADARARSLMTTDAALVDLIRKEFGPQSYAVDGSLNRTHISTATFGNPDRLKKLNELVHPRVAADYLNWVSENVNQSYILREAALLFESGSYRSVDKMIVVSAPEEIKVRRILLRDPQRTEDDIRKIMQSQWPEKEKLDRADYIIHNDDQHMVIPQVLALHQTFSAES
jgi:dephospho-CoA kinase